MDGILRNQDSSNDAGFDIGSGIGCMIPAAVAIATSIVVIKGILSSFSF